jgi:hypothetical protein
LGGPTAESLIKNKTIVLAANNCHGQGYLVIAMTPSTAPRSAKKEFLRDKHVPQEVRHTRKTANIQATRQQAFLRYRFRMGARPWNFCGRLLYSLADSSA